MIPPDPATPGLDEDGAPDDRADDEAPRRPSGGRPGAGTFTIEGRQAPALFVIGWLATLIGGGTIAIALLSGGVGAAPILLVVGLLALGVGLIAGAGSQAVERRARGGRSYTGPSPFLVFAASIPLSVVAVVAIAIPLTAIGIAVGGPVGRTVAIVLQAVIYIGLIRLLVVDAGALSWRAMGIRRPDREAVREMAEGALWVLPVLPITLVIAAILASLLQVTGESPLPPTGEASGFILNLIAGVIIAPIGEEILFRGFATTAWAADLGERRGIAWAAIMFAVAHVLVVTGDTAGEAVALAVVGFATRVPLAIALGWLFVRSRSIWVPIGLHAGFNAILLTLGEIALRSGAG